MHLSSISPFILGLINLDIYLLFNRNSSEIIKNYKDSYFLDINYLKYIPFSNIILKKVNIFISSYVTYVFPPNSKYIYIYVMTFMTHQW